LRCEAGLRRCRSTAGRRFKCGF